MHYAAIHVVRVSSARGPPSGCYRCQQRSFSMDRSLFLCTSRAVMRLARNKKYNKFSILRVDQPLGVMCRDDIFINLGWLLPDSFC